MASARKWPLLFGAKLPDVRPLACLEANRRPLRDLRVFVLEEAVEERGLASDAVGL